MIKEFAEKQLSYHIAREFVNKIKESDHGRAISELVKTHGPYFAIGKGLGVIYGVGFLEEISQELFEQTPIHSILEYLNFSAKTISNMASSDLTKGYLGQIPGGWVVLGGKYFSDKLHSKSL